MLGNPLNAIRSLFDPEIPLLFRIGIVIVGSVMWTVAIMAMTGKI